MSRVTLTVDVEHPTMASEVDVREAAARCVSAGFGRGRLVRGGRYSLDAIAVDTVTR